MELKVLKKIGILGGTFDPIHNGHLIMAEKVLETFKLDKILFIPTGNPSHKKIENISSKKNRFYMTKIAILDNPKFYIEDIEYKKEEPSYTYDTLCTLKETYCGELYFIVGDDSILDILNWYKSSELIKLCTFIVISRPNFNEAEVIAQIEMLQNNYNAKILRLDYNGFDISSTDIRNRVYSNKSIKYFVPKVVEEYIRQKELYYNKLTIAKKERKHIEQNVKSKMSEERYVHTRGVVDMGIRLAKLHGVDVNKAYLGCIFHDFAKEVDPSENYPIQFDEFEIVNSALKHGKIGAYLVEHLYDISDFDILNSIRFHTTGRSNMSDLEKVVYLADMIEYGRGMSKELCALRKICFKDLNQGMYYGLVLTKYFVEHIKKRESHPSLNSLIEEYKKYI